MANKVLLNNIDHGDLRVLARHGAAFGDGVNQVPIFPTEFEDVQREYPIFFRRGAEGGFQAVALLGFDRDENLFLSGDRWQAHYVPAVQARGPFSIVVHDRALSGAGEPEPMIHIDLDDPRVGREGEPLFLPRGGNAPYLEQVAGTLRRIYTGMDIACAMYAALEELELLQPVEVEVALDDARRYRLPELFTIDQDRLARLDAAALERLHRPGFLRLAFLAAASLGGVHRLIELKNRKPAP